MSNPLRCDITNQIVIIGPESFKTLPHSIFHCAMFVTGGFGASPNTRGRNITGHWLSSGKNDSISSETIMRHPTLQEVVEFWSKVPSQQLQKKIKDNYPSVAKKMVLEETNHCIRVPVVYYATYMVPGGNLGLAMETLNEDLLETVCSEEDFPTNQAKREPEEEEFAGYGPIEQWAEQ